MNHCRNFVLGLIPDFGEATVCRSLHVRLGFLLIVRFHSAVSCSLIISVHHARILCWTGHLSRVYSCVLLCDSYHRH